MGSLTGWHWLSSGILWLTLKIWFKPPNYDSLQQKPSEYIFLFWARTMQLMLLRVMLALWLSHLLLPLPTLGEEQALNYICRMKNQWRIIFGFPGAQSSHLQPTRTPEQRGDPGTTFKDPQWLREVPAEWGSGSCEVGLSHILTSAAPCQCSIYLNRLLSRSQIGPVPAGKMLFRWGWVLAGRVSIKKRDDIQEYSTSEIAWVPPDKIGWIFW